MVVGITSLSRMRVDVFPEFAPPRVVIQTASVGLSTSDVEELVTDRRSAPMSGEMLFEARAHVHVPAGTDLAKLRAALERIANDLMVEIKLEDRGAGAGRGR